MRAGPRPQDCITAAASHGHQPRWKRLDVPQPGELLIKFEPDLLKDIGDVFGIRATDVGNGIDEALIACDQISPGALVALEATVYQFVVNARLHGVPFAETKISLGRSWDSDKR